MTPLIVSLSEPGDVVLDPFGGSGSTALAAKMCGRHFILIEKLWCYYEAARPLRVCSLVAVLCRRTPHFGKIFYCLWFFSVISVRSCSNSLVAASAALCLARSAFPRKQNRFEFSDSLVAASSLPTLDLLERLGREMPEVFELAQVIGKWVWLEFNVAPVKAIREKLRALGFHWNAGRKCWQHPCGVPTVLT
jgi:hypothetical protein